MQFTEEHVDTLNEKLAVQVRPYEDGHLHGQIIGPESNRPYGLSFDLPTETLAGDLTGEWLYETYKIHQDSGDAEELLPLTSKADSHARYWRAKFMEKKNSLHLSVHAYDRDGYAFNFMAGPVGMSASLFSYLLAVADINGEHVINPKGLEVGDNVYIAYTPGSHSGVSKGDFCTITDVEYKIQKQGSAMIKVPIFTLETPNTFIKVSGSQSQDLLLTPIGAEKQGLVSKPGTIQARKRWGDVHLQVSGPPENQPWGLDAEIDATHTFGDLGVIDTQGQNKEGYHTSFSDTPHQYVRPNKVLLFGDVEPGDAIEDFVADIESFGKDHICLFFDGLVVEVYEGTDAYDYIREHAME